MLGGGGGGGSGLKVAEFVEEGEGGDFGEGGRWWWLFSGHSFWLIGLEVCFC